MKLKFALSVAVLQSVLAACGGSGESAAIGDGWNSKPSFVEFNLKDANSPQVSIDPNGVATVIWSQSGSGRNQGNIYANRYSNDTGWGLPEIIEDTDADANSPQIAVDKDGNAIAVWEEGRNIVNTVDRGSKDIFASRYTTGTGWNVPEPIDNKDLVDAKKPKIDVTHSGDAIAVWKQFDGIKNSIWVNHYTDASGWGTALLIENNNLWHAESPQIALDEIGNALVVWGQSDGSYTRIWSNFYDKDNGWGSPAVIDNLFGGDASKPQVAFDKDGNAFAVWIQHDGTANNVYVNHYTANSGWGDALLMENNGGAAFDPQIATDSIGNAMAIWTQAILNERGRVENRSMWASYYKRGSKWNQPELVMKDDKLFDATTPQIAFDPFGEAIAVWSMEGFRRVEPEDNDDGENSKKHKSDIWTSRYTIDYRWTKPSLIETDEIGTVGVPQVAIDSMGNIVAVWHGTEGFRSHSRDILANHYTHPNSE